MLVLSVSSTHVRSVHASGATTPVSSLRPSQITQPSFLYGCIVSFVSMSGGMASSVQPRPTLPEIPKMVICRDDPLLDQLQEKWSQLHLMLKGARRISVPQIHG